MQDHVTTTTAVRGNKMRAWLRSRPWRMALLAGLGSCATIAVLAFANAAEIVPLLIAPFGASCALVFGIPASPLAKPRNVIGGHLVSAFLGLAAAAFIHNPPLAMAVGVGLAVAGMLLTDTLHPPAGADPIVVVLMHAGWSFLVVPVLAGALLVVAAGAMYHHLITGHPYIPARPR